MFTDYLSVDIYELIIQSSNWFTTLTTNNTHSGNYDVNFMDDVGQTLLNWASAFGTLTMVEYLVKRGADVNRGQRSSSLHYTACFGMFTGDRDLLAFITLLVLVC